MSETKNEVRISLNRLVESRLRFKDKSSRDFASGNMQGREFAIQSVEYEELNNLFESSRDINVERLSTAFATKPAIDLRTVSNAFFRGYLHALRVAYDTVNEICTEPSQIPF